MLRLLLCLLVFVSNAHAAECTLYERSHPTFLLSGAHLSTGKCSTCASCHINGIFTGTPKSCVSCHNGDPRWSTVGRGIKHIPTQAVECSMCHNTVTFTTLINTNVIRHNALTGIPCKTCHVPGTGYLGGMETKSLNHRGGTTVKVDCSQAGCHRPLGNTGKLYTAWD